MKIRFNLYGDEQLLSQYYLNNLEHLKLWEFSADRGFHSLESWQQRLAARIEEQEQGRGAFLLALNDDQTQVIATCNLSAIQYGAFRACYMGYSVDKLYEGKGIMSQLCGYAISYAFRDLGLNRIMANYMPNNTRSASLLRRLGFEKEGLAKRYLKINDQWQDHILTSLINSETPR